MGKVTGNQAVGNVIMHRINIVIFARQFAALKYFSLNFQVEKGAAWFRFQVASTGPYDKGWSFALFSMAVYCLGSADSHLSKGTRNHYSGIRHPGTYNLPFPSRNNH